MRRAAHLVVHLAERKVEKLAGEKVAMMEASWEYSMVDEMADKMAANLESY